MENMNIKDDKEFFIKQGIKSQITYHIEEDSNYTIFGSTDRKSYEVRMTFYYNDEQEHCYLTISPWCPNPKEAIDKQCEEYKSKFTNKIYEKYFK